MCCPDAYSHQTAGMAGAYDGVKLPVTDLRAIFNMRWALTNTPLVWDLTASGPVAARAALAVWLLAAQVQVQTPVGLLVAVNVAVDRFMADVEQACYLFGAVLQAQVMINVMPSLARGDACVA